ncbi:MAG: hypothetical protein LBK95_04555 [Bifidobacteriaceae bacterium]|jgi:hypothetical protein|nr:hypothetical protein [Bifidobacteriaceae bacterium]
MTTPKPDFSDHTAAQAAVSNRGTPPEQLEAIAAAQPSLWRDIAAHPNVYPALLDWLEANGDESVRAAVNRARDQMPQPPQQYPPQPAPWSPHPSSSAQAPPSYPGARPRPKERSKGAGIAADIVIAFSLSGYPASGMLVRTASIAWFLTVFLGGFGLMFGLFRLVRVRIKRQRARRLAWHGVWAAIAVAVIPVLAIIRVPAPAPSAGGSPSTAGSTATASASLNTEEGDPGGITGTFKFEEIDGATAIVKSDEPGINDLTLEFLTGDTFALTIHGERRSGTYVSETEDTPFTFSLPGVLTFQGELHDDVLILAMPGEFESEIGGISHIYGYVGSRKS